MSHQITIDLLKPISYGRLDSYSIIRVEIPDDMDRDAFLMKCGMFFKMMNSLMNTSSKLKDAVIHEFVCFGPAYNEKMISFKTRNGLWILEFDHTIDKSFKFAKHFFEQIHPTPIIVIPRMKQIFPTLTAKSLLSVQPMSAPTGVSFALRTSFGKSSLNKTSEDESTEV